MELTTGKFLVALQQSATSLTLCDPSSLIDGAPRKETVALANFLAVFSGGILSFQKINTILACFVICARERGIEVTAERLTHEYGLTENEIKPQPFLRMAKESGLKTGMKEKLNWAYFSHLGRAWPVIAPMKNGKHILLAGFSDDHLLAYDPLAEEGVIRLNKEQFVPRWSGTLYLLKRRARLADEDQPFSLRWFIPEILRQKTVFFDIALAVLFIHAIALITPLFFQIVIDKVLVNQALTTLHTLVFSSVRSYSDS
ncbi:MAG: hypothetical protein LBU39_03655 [Desulfobulbaceae bacterium]|nr:hypothetical protein [Desulfobulbaceae bacterium]